jgi:GTPase Era involved in 16S rRNA processing
MRVDGRVQYVLVDTPGFQRARRALLWMRQRETSADLHELADDS